MKYNKQKDSMQYAVYRKNKLLTVILTAYCLLFTVCPAFAEEEELERRKLLRTMSWQSCLSLN